MVTVSPHAHGDITYRSEDWGHRLEIRLNGARLLDRIGRRWVVCLEVVGERRRYLWRDVDLALCRRAEVTLSEEVGEADPRAQLLRVLANLAARRVAAEIELANDPMAPT